MAIFLAVKFKYVFKCGKINNVTRRAHLIRSTEQMCLFYQQLLTVERHISFVIFVLSPSNGFIDFFFI